MIAFKYIITLALITLSITYSYSQEFSQKQTNLENLYASDISNIERLYLDRTYQNDSINERLTRLEKKLYNSTFENLPTPNRLNHLLTQEQENKFPSADPNPKKETFKDKLKKALQGEETGFTPELYNCPYLHQIGPSYNRGFYTYSDWANQNVYYPSVGINFP